MKVHLGWHSWLATSPPEGLGCDLGNILGCKGAKGCVSRDSLLCELNPEVENPISVSPLRSPASMA